MNIRVCPVTYSNPMIAGCQIKESEGISPPNSQVKEKRTLVNRFPIMVTVHAEMPRDLACLVKSAPMTSIKLAVKGKSR